ncbi:DSBA oxidoreductase [Novosphingobium marinum]|uniref:Protein-disulfide isomerase n=1 Tax=Novosphingobium marinum TaxID=1514948 RepID=A0A7Y9XVW1_9SPHN|nr:DsbA family protein [Novosphingobium marinum]NYH95576.1 protein-disulfide isomerase [Novosphingobium marinum]GGC28162.1 DSBA oxidoreductase [Novosphingobium marinum]
MTDRGSTYRDPKWLLALAIPVLLLGGAIGWFAHAGSGGSLGPGDRTAVENVVRDYILENPEILPQAMENLQRRESAAQLSGIRDEVETPFPGAVLGNPKGSVTLVEFSDYACGYCRQSVEHVKQLIAANPDLRVVMREMPILSPESTDAARMALAAARQGKYAAFHDAMFAAGRPSDATIEAAARAAGLDLARARQDARDPAIEAELAGNLDLGRRIGFNGTPSWIVGDSIMAGAVGVETLSRAIEEQGGA